MAPTVRRGTLLSLNREPRVRRGDIIAFNAPKALRTTDATYLLRRVVGLPGENIAVRGGRLLVNGHVLAEPYVAPGTASADFAPVHVPRSEYFVLGDNRGHSVDSIQFGPVPRSSIIGRLAIRH